MSNELRLTYVLCTGANVAYGEILDAVSKNLSRKRNLPATATVVFDMDTLMATHLDPQSQVRLKVYRHRTDDERAASNPFLVRQLVFYGVLPAENIIDDTEAGTTTCVFADPRIRFNQYYTANQIIYSAGQGDILMDLLLQTQARSGGDVRLNSGVSDISVIRQRTYEAGKNIAEAMQEMTQVINGCDIDVIPTDSGPTFMGTFNTYASQGTAKPKVIFSHKQRGFTNCDVERTFASVRTYATEQGVDDTQTPVVQSAGSPATSPWGLLESYATESDVSTAATLLAKAQGVVDQYQVPQSIWKIKNITREAPKPMIDYDLGDTIKLYVQRNLRLQGNLDLRVDGYDLDVQDDGECKVASLLLVDP